MFWFGFLQGQTPLFPRIFGHEASGYDVNFNFVYKNTLNSAVNPIWDDLVYVFLKTVCLIEFYICYQDCGECRGRCNRA